ncbi:methionine biosynthesis protein MetW [Spirochaetia bacterium 38H-sp]|uniref:Methionine biosynthesis protein MetW n=1 Tax=Rarispira pelagica TaxID=3141764 RepID=A0ABU9UD00_9SPIR
MSTDKNLNGYKSSPHIFKEIVDLIDEGSRVLDLGCGSGELLSMLKEKKKVYATGVDIEEKMVLNCIQRGLSVFQGDLDEGLKDYETGSYDYVILSHTLQVVKRPKELLIEMLRVGKKAIVNFPNFGYMGIRLQLLFKGRMPVTKGLPYSWYDTPNIHLCTRKDFIELSKEIHAKILKEIAFNNKHRIRGPLLNARSAEVCYLITKQ